MNFTHLLVKWGGTVVLICVFMVLTQIITSEYTFGVFLGGYLGGIVVAEFLNYLRSVKPEPREDEWESENI